VAEIGQTLFKRYAEHHRTLEIYRGKGQRAPGKVRPEMMKVNYLRLDQDGNMI